MSLYIYFNRDGAGKTYTMTALAIDFMLKKEQKINKLLTRLYATTKIKNRNKINEEIYKLRNKKVITSYPVIYAKPLNIKEKIRNAIFKLMHRKTQSKDLPCQKQIFESLAWEDINMKWKRDFWQESIHDAEIFIDEAQDAGLSNREWQSLSAQARRFIYAHRHNDNNIHVVSQSADDIDVYFLRRCQNFIEIKKRQWKFLKNPSSFSLNYYRTIDDYYSRMELVGKKKGGMFGSLSVKKKDTARFKRKKIKFNKSIAEAYNTKFYRDMRPEPTFHTWLQVMSEK